jgi:hypothetical protein
MMLGYYQRANLLTQAVQVATARLRRPVDRVAMLPGDRCLAQAGWRWMVLDVRPAAGGRDEDGAPFVGGGGPRVASEASDMPVLSGPCRRRAELLDALISYASGDLQASLDAVSVLRGERRCLVRVGVKRVAFKAVYQEDSDWWEIGRTESQDALEPGWQRFRRWLSRPPRA